MNTQTTTDYRPRRVTDLLACVALIIVAGSSASPPAGATTIGTSTIVRSFSLSCKVDKISTTFSEPARRAHNLWIYATHWHIDQYGYVQGSHRVNNSATNDTQLVAEDTSSVFTASSFHVEANHIALFCSGGLLTEWEDRSAASHDC